MAGWGRVIIPELGNLEAELEAKELTSRAVDPSDIIPAEYVQRGATITCRCVSHHSHAHFTSPQLSSASLFFFLVRLGNCARRA